MDIYQAHAVIIEMLDDHREKLITLIESSDSERERDEFHVLLRDATELIATIRAFDESRSVRYKIPYPRVTVPSSGIH